MIKLRETTYVWAMWFVNFDGSDWLACLLKQEGEKPHLIYRFRYHKDDRAHASADKKSWYEASAKGDDDTLAKKLEIAADGLFDEMKPRAKFAEKIVVRGNGERAAQMLSMRSWAHFRSDEKPKKGKRT